MLQKYFESTIYSKTIKYLLSNTPLPMYKTVRENDYIYKDNIYIYKHGILKCTKTGIFLGVDMKYSDIDYLLMSNKLKVTDDKDIMEIYNSEDNTFGKAEDGKCVVTSNLVRFITTDLADFTYLDTYIFGQEIPNVTSKYISNTDYYDSTTHKMLGEYLRCLRDFEDLNLMSMYNCYCNQWVDNVLLSSNGVTDVSLVNNNVTLVPIKFNTTYTIALDSYLPVQICGVLYDDSLIKVNGNFSVGDIINCNSISYSSPITFSVSTDKNEYLHKEKFLFLAIQLTNNITNNITVLEGDYTNICMNNIVDKGTISKLLPYKMDEICVSTPSLLYSNNKESAPFADKLIQYLLRNTIDCREYINENIQFIAEKLNLPKKMNVVWSNELRYTLYNKYMNLSDSMVNKHDILGYVDSDVESAIMKGWI